MPSPQHLRHHLPALLAAALLFPRPQARSEEWDLPPPAPVVSLRPDHASAADQLDCKQCHAAVVEEWARTAHAVAWVDQDYREEIAGRKKPELCHGCHIPEPLLVDGLAERAKARTDLLEHGVDCRACHLGQGGVWLSAEGRPTDAHPTAASPYLGAQGQSDVCATCHDTNIGPVVGIAKDFRESKQAERGRSCVGCHMPRVERVASDGSPARTGRSHSIQTPRDPSFLRRAFELSLAREGSELVLHVANRAGHRVPGLQGREMRFVARAEDATGALLAQGELAFDARRYLAVDQSGEIRLPAAAARIRVQGLHTDPRAAAPVSFLEEVLEPPH